MPRSETEKTLIIGDESECTQTELVRETLFAAVDADHLDWTSEEVRDELDAIFSLSHDQWKPRLERLGLSYDQIRERAERRRAPTQH